MSKIGARVGALLKSNNDTALLLVMASKKVEAHHPAQIRQKTSSIEQGGTTLNGSRIPVRVR